MAEPSYEELKARLAELEKQGGTRRTGQLDFRVGEKGGVSVYGLGRCPVTLYYEQWTRLLDASTQLRAFLEENKEAGKLPDIAVTPVETSLTLLESLHSRWVKLLGLVNCAPGFSATPGVINGFSELVLELWGDAGRHARSAIGVAELPFDIPVGVEAILEVQT